MTDFILYSVTPAITGFVIGWAVASFLLYLRKNLL